jgi:phosphoserine phosphatase
LHPDDKAGWLDIPYAAEIMCQPGASFAAEHINNDDAFQALRDAAAVRHLDVNIVPAVGRRKKLLIADMDSTIITSETLDDLAGMAGIGDAVAAITKRSMAGEIDFQNALFERVAMLRGHPSQLFDALITAAEPTSGAIALVQTMRANGAKCYLISGGFDFITKPMAELCGFHDHHANHMHVDNGKILGTVKNPVLDREAKANYLSHYCKIHNFDASEAATIGDGANDLAMLQAAGMGVAFAGKPILRDKIAVQLNHTDLHGLLYLQGYHKANFIAE